MRNVDSHVKRLEKKVSFLSFVVVLLCVYVVVITTSGMAPNPAVMSVDDIAAKRIAIVDDQKRKLITLGVDEGVGGPAISVMDKKGRVRGVIAYSGLGDVSFVHVADERTARAGFSSHPEGSQVRVWDASGREAAAMSVVDKKRDIRSFSLRGRKGENVLIASDPTKGSSFVRINDNERVQLSLSYFRGRRSALSMFDDRGVLRALLGMKDGEDPTIKLADADGASMLQLP